MKLTRLDKIEMAWIYWRPLIWAALIFHAFLYVFWFPEIAAFDLIAISVSICFDRYLIRRMPKKQKPEGFTFRARGIEYEPHFEYKGLVVIGRRLRVHHWEAKPTIVPADICWDELRLSTAAPPPRSLVTMMIDRDKVEETKEPT